MKYCILLMILFIFYFNCDGDDENSGSTLCGTVQVTTNCIKCNKIDYAGANPRACSTCGYHSSYPDLLEQKDCTYFSTECEYQTNENGSTLTKVKSAPCKNADPDCTKCDPGCSMKKTSPELCDDYVPPTDSSTTGCIKDLDTFGNISRTIKVFFVRYDDSETFSGTNARDIIKNGFDLIHTIFQKDTYLSIDIKEDDTPAEEEFLSDFDKTEFDKVYDALNSSRTQNSYEDYRIGIYFSPEFTNSDLAGTAVRASTVNISGDSDMKRTIVIPYSVSKETVAHELSHLLIDYSLSSGDNINIITPDAPDPWDSSVINCSLSWSDTIFDIIAAESCKNGNKSFEHLYPVDGDYFDASNLMVTDESVLTNQQMQRIRCILKNGFFQSK